MTTYTRYSEIIERFRSRASQRQTPGVILAVVAELPNGDGEVYVAANRRDAVRDFQKSVRSGQYKQVVLLRGAITMAQWQDMPDEDAPRPDAVGGGNPAANLDAPEALGAEYSQYRDACDMAERIAPQARISEAAALELAKRVVAGGSVASSVLVGTALYGLDTTLYGVIYAGTDGFWHLYYGWLKPDGTLHVLDCARHQDVKTLRWCFTFTFREALLVGVAI